MNLSRREVMLLLGSGVFGLSCGRDEKITYPHNGPMSTVAVGDIKISYGAVGTGDPVLLLHGQGAHANDWSLQIAALSKKYRVFFPDMRGHGGSSGPKGPYTMAMLAADMAGFCRSLSLPPCHVIGHSLGGAVALQLALDAPALVRSVSVVNSAVQVTRSCVQVTRSWLVSQLIRLSIRTQGMPGFARLNFRYHLPDSDQEPLRKRLLETMGSNSADGYLASQAALDGWNVTQRLGEIRCPVLVVHSDKDLIPIAGKKLIAEKVQRGRLIIIEKSRHLVLWDQPERLNAVLLEFLAQRDG